MRKKSVREIIKEIPPEDFDKVGGNEHTEHYLRSDSRKNSFSEVDEVASLDLEEEYNPKIFEGEYYEKLGKESYTRTAIGENKKYHPLTEKVLTESEKNENELDLDELIDIKSAIEKAGVNLKDVYSNAEYDKETKKKIPTITVGEFISSLKTREEVKDLLQQYGLPKFIADSDAEIEEKKKELISADQKEFLLDRYQITSGDIKQYKLEKDFDALKNRYDLEHFEANKLMIIEEQKKARSQAYESFFENLPRGEQEKFKTGFNAIVEKYDGKEGEKAKRAEEIIKAKSKDRYAHFVNRTNALKEFVRKNNFVLKDGEQTKPNQFNPAQWESHVMHSIKAREKRADEIVKEKKEKIGKNIDKKFFIPGKIWKFFSPAKKEKHIGTREYVKGKEMNAVKRSEALKEAYMVEPTKEERKKMKELKKKKETKNKRKQA